MSTKAAAKIKIRKKLDRRCKLMREREPVSWKLSRLSHAHCHNHRRQSADADLSDFWRILNYDYKFQRDRLNDIRFLCRPLWLGAFCPTVQAAIPQRKVRLFSIVVCAVLASWAFFLRVRLFLLPHLNWLSSGSSSAIRDLWTTRVFYAIRRHLTSCLMHDARVNTRYDDWTE